MPNENDTRSFLEERKAAILAELRALAPELITEYLKISAAIDGWDAAELDAIDDDSENEEIVPTSYEYASVIKPSDAWVRYLSAKGAPVTRKVIAKELALAGWGSGGRVVKPRDTLMSMFKYYLGEPKKNRPPRAKSEPPVKELNGLVGLIEWPEADFVLKRDDGTIIIGQAKNITSQK